MHWERGEDTRTSWSGKGCLVTPMAAGRREPRLNSWTGNA